MKSNQIGYFGMMGATKPKAKRKSIPKAVKEKVWFKYFGHRMNGKCYACRRPISFTNFEVGHNKPRSKGGKDTVSNLRPICRSCNRSMGTMSIETFKRRYFSTKKTTKKRKTMKVKAVINPFTGETKLIPRKKAKRVINEWTGKKYWVPK